jgi:hypothetical protein
MCGTWSVNFNLKKQIILSAAFPLFQLLTHSQELEFNLNTLQPQVSIISTTSKHYYNTKTTFISPQLLPREENVRYLEAFFPAMVQMHGSSGTS